MRRAILTAGTQLDGATTRGVLHNMRACNGSALDPSENACEQALKQLTGAEMAGARFCAIAAGDTPSTGRLYDSIACLCVPVILVDDLQLPFPRTRPLPPSSYGVRYPEADFLADPLGAARRILEGAAGPPGARNWRGLQRLLLPARRALAYRHAHSDVATLVLREAWAGCLQERRSTARPVSQVAKC